MRKGFYLLALLLLSCMAFAQTNLPFTSLKPINKDKIVLHLGYEKQPESGLHNEAPKICLSAGYGFTNWCVAGFYADFGRDFMSYRALGLTGRDENGEPIDVYWLEYHSNYLAYGAHAELHPVALLLPNFYFLDVYALVRAGLHHYFCSVVSETGYDESHITETGDLKNSAIPYLAGGWGVAINPSKYFGFFYERTYNSLTDHHLVASSSLRHHLYQRLGLNIRFGGPKKWQNQQ
ncbi:MAG: hypothetical protein J6T22_13885 [Bacteroidales bacterium]|nr:hypothetical protein [Bacteroidales bacterium]